MDAKNRKQLNTNKKVQKRVGPPKQDSTKSRLAKDREHEDSIMSDCLEEDIEALENPKSKDGAEVQLCQIMGKFTDISKDMLKSAIDQLRPEFEQMAVRAVTRAVELRDKRVQELLDELSGKENDLKQLKLDKKKLAEQAQQNAGIIQQKDREIKHMEREIDLVKQKLKRRESEMKKEKARAGEEEAKRVELEKSLQAEIDKLRKELDTAKSHRGMMKAAKGLGELEIKKLREREKELIEQLEKMKSQR